MKILYVICISVITFNIFPQKYADKDFNLKGKVRRLSVLCYEYELIDGEYIEGLPYSTQKKYHTDLNLHYLEFNKEGYLKRSLLYYPRDFYGQFTWLLPEFDLESSDFSEKKNYLSAMFRYKYSESEGMTNVSITSEDGTEVNLQIDSNNRLTEDEYYIYEEISDNNKSILTKKRKGSNYGYRRTESMVSDDKTIISEYINNRFIVSKKIIVTSGSSKESIFVSQSRIELSKESYDSFGRVSYIRYVKLNWKNKFLKWPEIDFSNDHTYISFLDDLDRESDEYGIEFKYNSNNQVIEKVNYRISYDNKIPIRKTNLVYIDGILARITVDPNPQVVGDIYFKEYVYDSYGNWTEKILGIEKNLKGKKIRIPTKKYVKTLTYWD